MPEAMLPTVDILRSMSLDLDIQTPIYGQEALAKCGTGFPPETRDAIDSSAAVLFGANGGPSRGVLVHLRRDVAA